MGFQNVVTLLWFDVDSEGETTWASVGPFAQKLWFDVDSEGETTLSSFR